MMRTVLFVTVLSLICLNAVQANRISQPAHTSPFIHSQRSKHTLQRLAMPKLSPTTSNFYGDFTIRVTFANCMNDNELTADDFSFDENFEVSNVVVSTIVSGLQFLVKGTATVLPAVDVPATGLSFTAAIRAEAVRFYHIVSTEGIPNDKAQVTFTYIQAQNFKSVTSALQRLDAESKYVGFAVTFGSFCVPAPMKTYSQSLYSRYFKVSSASGKAKIFSVQTIGTSGSTCRSDLGSTEATGACPRAEQEAEFQVWVTTTAPDDVVTLRTKKGLCRTFAGGISTASTDSATVNTGRDECGPWSEFSSCGGCFDVVGFGTSSKFEQTRTRQALPGRKCKVTTERRSCRSKPCDMFASRPRSGETRTECYGCNTMANYQGWTTSNGCKCGQGCEATGDCCQSWYYYGCQNTKQTFGFELKGWSPRQCSSSTCQVTEPIIDNEFPSYFCYCGSNCASNDIDLCCDGKVNRDAQCTAVAPGAAPGQGNGGL